MTPAEVLRKWQACFKAGFNDSPVTRSNMIELCAELAAALESPPAKGGDGWTECRLELPDVAYHRDWGVSTGQRVSGGAGAGVAGDWAGSDIATHWRPLPEGP